MNQLAGLCADQRSLKEGSQLVNSLAATTPEGIIHGGRVTPSRFMDN